MGATKRLLEWFYEAEDNDDLREWVEIESDIEGIDPSHPKWVLLKVT